MKVIRKTKELNCIQYINKNTIEITSLLRNKKLVPSMDGSLLIQDDIASGIPSYKIVRDGNFIIEKEDGSIEELSIAKFNMEYSLVR